MDGTAAAETLQTHWAHYCLPRHREEGSRGRTVWLWKWKCERGARGTSDAQSLLLAATWLVSNHAISIGQPSRFFTMLHATTSVLGRHGFSGKFIHISASPTTHMIVREVPASSLSLRDKMTLGYSVWFQWLGRLPSPWIPIQMTMDYTMYVVSKTWTPSQSSNPLTIRLYPYHITLHVLKPINFCNKTRNVQVFIVSIDIKIWSGIH